MNRWLAILILSIGTTILVAHSAIPHHHHEGVVCYHHDEGSNHAQEASHQHHPVNPLDFNCSLKQLYLTPPFKIEITPLSIETNWSYFSYFGFANFMNIQVPPEAFPLKFLTYYALQAFSDPVIFPTSPRAPPLS